MILQNTMRRKLPLIPLLSQPKFEGGESFAQVTPPDLCVRRMPCKNPPCDSLNVPGFFPFASKHTS